MLTAIILSKPSTFAYIYVLIRTYSLFRMFELTLHYGRITCDPDIAFGPCARSLRIDFVCDWLG